MERCFDAVEMIVAFGEERQPFGDVPPPEVCIRLGLVSPRLMNQICTYRNLVVVRVEQRNFPDGEDTVYVVQTT